MESKEKKTAFLVNFSITTRVIGTAKNKNILSEDEWVEIFETAKKQVKGSIDRQLVADNAKISIDEEMPYHYAEVGETVYAMIAGKPRKLVVVSIDDYTDDYEPHYYVEDVCCESGNFSDFLYANEMWKELSDLKVYMKECLEELEQE